MGNEGTVSIQEGRGQHRTEVEYLEGYNLEAGFLSPYFAEEKKREKGKMIEFENGVYIVTFD